jgi:5-methylcytosine-specific restriction endonuclease McrA
MSAGKNAYNVKYRRSLLVKLKKESGGKCVICGYDRNYACIDFHHIIPAQKSFAINASTVTVKSWDTLTAEAAKCVLLCRNCHTDFHFPATRSSRFIE